MNFLTQLQEEELWDSSICSYTQSHFSSLHSVYYYCVCVCVLRGVHSALHTWRTMDTSVRWVSPPTFTRAQERDINKDCPEAEAEAKTSRKQKLPHGGCGEQG